MKIGYVEGGNLIVQHRHHPEGKELSERAADLVRLKVDVIVAAGSLTPHAAKRATTTIPIVMTNHGDPVGSALVTSLARPGGNITGLSILSTELVGKQLELLKQAVPRVVVVAVLSTSRIPWPRSAWRTCRTRQAGGHGRNGFGAKSSVSTMAGSPESTRDCETW